MAVYSLTLSTPSLPRQCLIVLRCLGMSSSPREKGKTEEKKILTPVWGAWVQSIKDLTLDFVSGRHLTVVRLIPMSGSMLGGGA